MYWEADSKRRFAHKNYNVFDNTKNQLLLEFYSCFMVILHKDRIIIDFTNLFLCIIDCAHGPVRGAMSIEIFHSCVSASTIK